MSKVLDSFEPKALDYGEIEDLEPKDIEKALELEAKIKLKCKQRKQFADMTDTQYYAVVVFGNEHDKEKWLDTLEGVDVEYRRFIDGYQLAKKYGTDIEMTASLPAPKYVKQFKLKSK
ncbi:MAG: hypothetical protein FWF53_01235 [Candidatus Azobacteroides sp.]|nr:hypothetical protein [Candidatus Azobacteroides sp.]